MMDIMLLTIIAHVVLSPATIHQAYLQGTSTMQRKAPVECSFIQLRHQFMHSRSSHALLLFTNT